MSFKIGKENTKNTWKRIFTFTISWPLTFIKAGRIIGSLSFWLLHLSNPSKSTKNKKLITLQQTQEIKLNVEANESQVQKIFVPFWANLVEHSWKLILKESVLENASPPECEPFLLCLITSADFKDGSFKYVLQSSIFFDSH